MTMRKVAVVGIGQLPFRSRYPDKSYLRMAMEVSKKALHDAGLSPKDVDGAVYPLPCEIMLRQQFAELWLQDYLGLQGKPMLKVTALAATSGHGIFAAFNWIASGMADIILVVVPGRGNDVYDFETRSRGDGIRKYGYQMHQNLIWETPVFPGGVPAPLTAANLLPHIEKYGTPTIEQLAKVAVKNHKNGLVNPMAQLKLDLTVDEVLNSRIVAWPTTLYQCSLQSEGAAALVLASEEKAKEMHQIPIWIAGVACSEYAVGSLMTEETLGRLRGQNIAAQKAYEMAGIKDPLNELDVIEVLDFISGLEIMLYEEFGLCKLGEGGRLVDEKVTEKNGWMPVNPSGGCGARGHYDAVTGVHATGDIVLQLREQAGPIQVPIRKRGMGLMSCASGLYDLNSIVILQRER
jgi:acetyl-CoA C-acetyltransferase